MASKRGTKRRFTSEEVAKLLQEDDSTDNDSDADIDDSASDSDFLDNTTQEAQSTDASSDSDTEGYAVDGDDNSESETETSPASWVKCSDGVTPKQLLFTAQNVGVQLTDSNIPDSILGFFQLYFTEDLLREIVVETNQYAKEKLSDRELLPRSVWHKWTDVTEEELKGYFGVILRMAMHQCGDIQQFFSSQWIDYMPFYGDVFSRERFLLIHWMLHVQPPTTDDGAARVTRGSKVKNVVVHMKQKCLELFHPYQNIVIDESTISFKGRTQYKMYNPQKPHKWGLRVFSLADSKTGYLCGFEPYYGSATTNSLPRPDLQFTARIVLHLCSEVTDKVGGEGYHLFTDRYYTGHILAVELLKKNIHTTGTVMRNRQGLPAEIKRNLKLKKYEVASWSLQNKEVVVAWQDKRTIYMLTTYYSPATQMQQRRIRKGEVEEFPKPTAIVEYTKHMGAVDRFDHYCSSYAFTRKSLKWWRKTFFWLLEVAVVNSYILYNETHPDEPVDHIRYRKQLILQLVGEQRRSRPSRRRGRPSTLDKEERLDKRQHFIAAFSGKKTKDCRVCSDRKTAGSRHKTIYYCETCSRHPGLHPGDCFKKYHSQTKFR